MRARTTRARAASHSRPLTTGAHGVRSRAWIPLARENVPIRAKNPGQLKYASAWVVTCPDETSDSAMPTCRHATSPRVVLEANDAAPYIVTTRAHSSVAIAHWLVRWCAPEPRARTKAPLSTTMPTQYAGGSVCTSPRSLLIGSVTERAAKAARTAASRPTTTYGAPAHLCGRRECGVISPTIWALVMFRSLP